MYGRTSRWLLTLVVLSGASALAQDDTPDAASIPDASVGQGGADFSSPEFDETSTATCLGDRDCDKGFHCDKGRCVPRRWRDATCGCGASGALPFIALLLLISRTARSRGRGPSPGS